MFCSLLSFFVSIFLFIITQLSMSGNNIAKQAFEIPKKGGSSGDYITNKKSKLLMCSRQGICNNKKVSSYEQKGLIKNGQLLNEPIESYTYDLYSNLQTQLNYEGANTITNLNGAPTCINAGLIPFYNYYKIDADGDLFGKTTCASNNYVNYRVPLVPTPPTNTVYWN